MDSFKNWLDIQETRFKGFKRQFVASNPELPKYVADDLYNTRVGYTLRQILKKPVHSGLADTVAMADRETGYSTSSNKLASKIINAHDSFRDMMWTQKPILLQVCPLDFDGETINIMLKRRFGFLPYERIRDDEKRTLTQTSLMTQKNLGENEPIIVTKIKGKYHLLEGWHRTMAYLVYEPNPEIGAPPDQIDLLKSGQLDAIKLELWKRVPILAYVGE